MYMKETEKTEDDEISLLDLFAVLLHYKWMIIGISVVAAVGVVVFAVISLTLPPERSPMPNKYTPSAQMLIQGNSSSGGGLSSALASSGLSSFMGLAGVSGGPTNSSLATFLASSNTLLDAVTDNFGIIERYKIEKYVRASSRKALKKTLTTAYDDETGVFSVSFTDIDPEFARGVVNFVVDWLGGKFDELGLDTNKIQKENLERNIQSSYDEILRLEREMKRLGASVGASAWSVPSVTTETAKLQLELDAQRQVYTQLRTQYELLKVQMQSETPIFQILERPEVPDMKSGPSRGKLCIIVTFAAFFLAVFLAFALNALGNIKNDPEAMEKLRPAKRQRRSS